MKRFVLHVLLISLIAAIAWWATMPWTRAGTIAGAKWLHALVGYPAPHLLADLDHYHWFAPLFPPLVGLIWASRWLTRRARAVGLLFALAAFWYLVSLQIAVVYSPYLTLSAARAYVMSIQIALNSVVVPVVLWLIVAGSPAGRWDRKPDTSANAPRPAFLVRSAGGMLAFSLVMTLPVPLLTSQTTPTLSAARDELARSLSADNPALAVQAIDTMFTVQPRNAALSYLQMELHQRLGHADAVVRLMPAALTDAKRRAAYRVLHR